MNDRDRYFRLIEELRECLDNDNLTSLDLNDLKLELEALRDRVTAYKNRKLIAECKQILRM